MMTTDVMGISENPTIHIAEVNTHYSGARFVLGESVDEVGETFLHFWVSTYTGSPDTFQSESKSLLTSKRWNKYVSQI